MTRLEYLINKAATCGRYMTAKEEGELKTLHEEHMESLSTPEHWDFVELKKMRYEKT